MSNEVNPVPRLDEYMRQIQNTGGKILQLNRVGVITIATGYRGLGLFEAVAWDDRNGHNPAGELVSYWDTLETAEGFHHALLALIWKGGYGNTMRLRAREYRVVAKEYYDELQNR